MEASTPKLSFREKFGYGLGDTACHFAWDMAGMFLFFFLPMCMASQLLWLVQLCL